MNTVPFHAACPRSIWFPLTISEDDPASVPFPVRSLLPRRSVEAFPWAAGAALPAERSKWLSVCAPGSPEPVWKCGSVRALLQTGQTPTHNLHARAPLPDQAEAGTLREVTPSPQKVEGPLGSRSALSVVLLLLLPCPTSPMPILFSNGSTFLMSHLPLNSLLRVYFGGPPHRIPVSLFTTIRTRCFCSSPSSSGNC